jgi:hypothetical protein
MVLAKRQNRIRAAALETKEPAALDHSRPLLWNF